MLDVVLAQGAALEIRDGRRRGDREAVGSLSKSELVRRTEMSKETVWKAIADLVDDGWVESTDHLRLTDRFGYVLSLSLGTESARGALVDANGLVSHLHRCTPVSLQLVDDSPQLLMNRLAAVAHAVLAAALEARDSIPLIGVAVAWPTPLDARTKVPSARVLRHTGWQKLIASRTSVNELVARRLLLDDWVGRAWASRQPSQTMAVASAAEARLWESRGSHAINDASAAAASICFSVVRQRALDNAEGHPGAVVAIRIGGGVGAGIMLLGRHASKRSAFLESRLIEGRGYTGEIAHLPLSTADVQALSSEDSGLRALTPLKACGCGREICLDAVASSRAILKRVRDAGVLNDELAGARTATEAFGTLLSYANSNDGPKGEAVRAAFHQAGQFFGRALAGSVMLLNPSIIAMTGTGADVEFEHGIRSRRSDWEHVHDELQPELRTLSGIENEVAPLRGAALLVLRRRLYEAWTAEKYKHLDLVARPYGRRQLTKLESTIVSRDHVIPELDAERLYFV